MECGIVQQDRNDRSLQTGGTLDGQIDRAWRFRLDPVTTPAQSAVDRKRRADPGAKRRKGVVAFSALYHGFDFGPVLIVIAQGREGHARVTRVAIAQDQEARRWHAFGQNLATQHRHMRDRAQQVSQGCQDVFSGGGHDASCRLGCAAAFQNKFRALGSPSGTATGLLVRHSGQFAGEIGPAVQKVDDDDLSRIFDEHDKMLA